MTSAPALGHRRRDGRQGVVQEALPFAAPADAVIRALHTALHTALVPRADGSRHDRNCINRHVNAIPRACSPACEYATGAMLLAEDWLEG